MTDISRIPEIQDWIDIVENDTYKCSKDQKLLVKHFVYQPPLHIV